MRKLRLSLTNFEEVRERNPRGTRVPHLLLGKKKCYGQIFGEGTLISYRSSYLFRRRRVAGLLGVLRGIDVQEKGGAIAT